MSIAVEWRECKWEKVGGLRHVLGVLDRDVEGDKIISKVTYSTSARGPSPACTVASPVRLCICHYI